MRPNLSKTAIYMYIPKLNYTNLYYRKALALLPTRFSHYQIFSYTLLQCQIVLLKFFRDTMSRNMSRSSRNYRISSYFATACRGLYSNNFIVCFIPRAASFYQFIIYHFGQMAFSFLFIKAKLGFIFLPGCF